MWVTCLQENLSRGLATVGRAVASRATLPVTQNVLLQADGNRLKITATNLEIAISTWIGAQIEGEGAVTIPARTLSDFVNLLPPQKVEIDLTTDPWGIDLKCANFTANLNGTNPDDFPPIPTVEDGASASIPADNLRGSLERVVFAAATDDSRPVLTGVKLDISGSEYTVAAADGFRLAVESGNLAEETEAEIGVIVPSRTLTEILRQLGDQTSNVEVRVTEARSQALFALENVEVVSQLVQGVFPDYEKLIPTSHGTSVKVDLEDFVRATRAASIFARDGSGIVRLYINPAESGPGGEIRVQSKAEDVGNNESVIQADVEGEESKVAFNSKFLTDVLAVMGGEDVTLETTTSSSPGVVRATRHQGYTHVVMPMFVQW